MSRTFLACRGCESQGSILSHQHRLLSWCGWLVMAVVLACRLDTAARAAEEPIKADVVLQGGLCFDGTGAEGRIGDVAIRNGKILAVGRSEVKQVERVINCRGLVIAPGFIDLHTHCDSLASNAKLRPNRNYLLQGCTTVITGNCGGGPTDVEEYLKKLDQHGAGTNVIHLVPHGSVRAKVMGSDDRAPTAQELERMRSLVEQGMRGGAWGMSTGLIYTPGLFAKTDELIELVKVVAAHGGIYVSHIRGEGSELLRSVQEALEIGRAANLPVHISHFKATGKPNWGQVHKAAALVEAARRSGLSVTADQYPYIATSTGLGPTLFPTRKIPGGMKNFAQRVQNDADYMRQVRKIVQGDLRGAHKIMIASCKKYPQYVAKSLDEIAAARGMDVADLAIEIQANGSASVVKFSLSEDDVRWVMTLPWVATGSDGGPHVPDRATCPHPRSYGTFPRKIGLYALREKTIPMAQAIRSATGLPSDILKLTDRGYLRSGYVADLVVFDPKTFIDRATFEQPHQYADGVRYVFLAGHTAIDDGTPSQQLFGRAIRHQKSKQARE
jgi:N-acyl-D-amino-acid deacylase